MAMVLTSAAVLVDGGLFEEPPVARTMMRTITRIATSAPPHLKACRIRLARSSAARRSAAFRCSSARRCALDFVPLVMVRPI